MGLLHAEITNYILDKIQNGEWPEGHLIPTEIQLSETFGVSRPTVRTALLNLVNQGKLRRVKGKGTFVTKPKHLDHSTVYIESFAEASSIYKIKRELLEFRICQPDEIISRLMGNDDEVIKITRLMYVEGPPDNSPIVLANNYFPKKYSFLFKCDLERQSLRMSLKNHNVIRTTFCKELIPVVLTPKECRLLNVEEDSLGMLVISTDKDAEDNIVNVTQSFYPASKNRFELYFTA